MLLPRSKRWIQRGCLELLGFKAGQTVACSAMRRTTCCSAHESWLLRAAVWMNCRIIIQQLPTRVTPLHSRCQTGSSGLSFFSAGYEQAGMAELADAADSKSADPYQAVGFRPPLPA